MCWMFYLKDACTVLTYFWIKVKNDVGMLKCKSILSWCNVLISWVREYGTHADTTVMNICSNFEQFWYGSELGF